MKNIILNCRVRIFGVLRGLVLHLPLGFRRGSGFYRFFRQGIYDFLKPKINFQVSVKGHRMLVPGKDRAITDELMTPGRFEPFETRLFESAVKKGMTVVDVGANFGYYTLLAARLAGPSGKVYDFEPDEDNYKLLSENVSRNGYTNVVLERAAVSRGSGTQTLFRDALNYGAHSLSQANLQMGQQSSIVCRTVSLDDYFADKPGRIDIIKIDVQGAEGLAFEGAQKLIKQNKYLRILLEFWPSGLLQMQTDPVEFLHHFEKQGFRIRLITPGGLQPAGDIAELVRKLEKNLHVNLLIEGGI